MSLARRLPSPYRFAVVRPQGRAEGATSFFPLRGRSAEGAEGASQ